MPTSDELAAKLERTRALMDERGVAALWLRRVENVGWITGGVDVAVDTASAFGVASVVITRDTCELWTDTIEAPRLRAEDRLEERGFTFHVAPWHAPGERPVGDPLGVDDPLPGAVDLTRPLTALRTRLLPVEQERFRTLAVNGADALCSRVTLLFPLFRSVASTGGRSSGDGKYHTTASSNCCTPLLRSEEPHSTGTTLPAIVERRNDARSTSADNSGFSK